MIPKYVIKRNEDTKKAQEEYDVYVRETLKQKAMKRLTEEERETLLEVHYLRNTATETGVVSLDGALELFYVVCSDKCQAGKSVTMSIWKKEWFAFKLFILCTFCSWFGFAQFYE